GAAAGGADRRKSKRSLLPRLRIEYPHTGGCMKRTAIIAAAAAMLISGPAMAREKVMTGECRMKENVTVGVNFNQRVKGFAEARSVFEDTMKKVEALAKQHDIKNLV